MYSLRNISGNEQIKPKSTIYVDTFSNSYQEKKWLREYKCNFEYQWHRSQQRNSQSSLQHVVILVDIGSIGMSCVCKTSSQIVLF